MPTPPLNAAELLEILGRHGAETIVVGAVAAVMAGAPLVTFDLDLVYRQSSDNYDRLLSALHEISAVYRDPGGRRIVPTAERLERMRLHLLETPFGGLDLLAMIGPNLGYPELMGRSTAVPLRGRRIFVLDLAAVIEAKEFADRPKDRAMLPVLRETLRSIQARGKMPEADS